MSERKKLKELTIKDNFMFSAVMMEEENCRRFLELALQFPIERVEVSKEKSIIYHPEYKGVRLDVYAKDENNTRYNVEMQVATESTLGKRSRYYHSQIDMELLLSGGDYAELPDVYVIFICDFDPFHLGKYRYTFTKQCEETELHLNEGCQTIFFSTKGTNPQEVPSELVKFLNFVKADLEQSEMDFEDNFVKKLQETIRHIKSSREMEERYMLFEELLRNERAEGLTAGIAQSILVILSDFGDIPEELQRRIMNEKNPDTLNRWLKLAARSASLDDFLKQI